MLDDFDDFDEDFSSSLCLENWGFLFVDKSNP